MKTKSSVLFPLPNFININEINLKLSMNKKNYIIIKYELIICIIFYFMSSHPSIYQTFII